MDWMDAVDRVDEADVDGYWCVEDEKQELTERETRELHEARKNLCRSML